MIEENEIDIIFKGNFQNPYLLDITFTLKKGLQEIPVTLRAFNWESIYGKVDILRLDEEDNTLKKAKQTPDGRYILPEKSTSEYYMDIEGKVHHSANLVKTDLEGNPLSIHPSIDKQVLEMSGFKLIKLEDFFLYETETTYVVEAKDPKDESELLELWKYYWNLYETKELLARFRYGYRRTTENRWCIIIPHSEKRLVIYLCKKTDLEFTEKEQLKDLFDIETIEEEEEVKFEEYW